MANNRFLTQRRRRHGQWTRSLASSPLCKAAQLKFKKVKFAQVGYRAGRDKAVTSDKPERVFRFMHLLKAFSSSEYWQAGCSCKNEPVPSSVNRGAWISSLGNCSKVIFLLTFKTFNDLHLLTSLSRASKLTSLLKLAKFSTSNEEKFSGKQLNQLPLLSLRSFSCMSSSVKFL